MPSPIWGYGPADGETEDPPEVVDSGGGPILGSGAWFRDAKGRDVFDDVNSPLSGKPIFDPIDVSKTFGGVFGGVGETVGKPIDSVNETLRNLGATTPAGLPAQFLPGAIEDVSGLGQDVQNTAGNPSSVSGMLHIVLVIVVLGGALYLLQPILDIGANLTEPE